MIQREDNEHVNLRLYKINMTYKRKTEIVNANKNISRDNCIKKIEMLCVCVCVRVSLKFELTGNYSL